MILLLAALLPLVVLSGCVGVASGNGSNPGPTPQASLQVSPGTVDFGSTAVGTKVSKAATVTNTGNTALTVTQVTMSSQAFAISGLTLPLALPPNQAANFTLWFNSTAAGAASGTLTLQTDVGATSAPVNLTAMATTAGPNLTVSPTSLSFGSVVSGATKVLPVLITNPGTTTLTISQAAVTGSSYTTGLTLPLAIPGGQSSTFNVTFAPKSAGSLPGNVVLTSDAANSPTTIQFTGTGVAATSTITATPTSLAFGSVTAGSSLIKTVTLANTGNSTATISAINATGAGITTSGVAIPATVNAGQSVTLSVQFAPTAAGAVTGGVAVVTAQGTTNISLTATGVAATSTITANPTSLAFGSVATGGSSVKTVVLSNTGNSTATISAINATGAGVTTSGVATPATVNAGQSVTLSVRFAPTAAGAVTGGVAVVTAQGTTNVSLTGTGTQAGLSVTPGSATFGSVVVGATNSQTLQLKNTGNAALTISQATVTGAAFGTTGLTVPLTLSAGQTSNFNVLFTPQAAGAVTGSLSIVSNAPNSPANVVLSGTGTAATRLLAPNPTSLSFGNVTLGVSSSKSLAISNTGNSSVTISAVNVTGVGLSVSGAATPVTLAPAQSMNLTVQYLPLVAAVLGGNISVVSNASGSTSVSVSGTGVAVVQHSVSLNWAASSSTVTGYNVYRSTVSGGSYTQVNSGVIGGLTYTDSSVQSGSTYFYVTTAVDSTGGESVYSNEVQAVIP